MRDKRKYRRHTFVLLLAAAGMIICTSPISASSGLASAQAFATSWNHTGSFNTTTLRANGKIAFTSDRDGNREIYVMNPDGTNQVRLTNNSIVDDCPTWSPDGTKIAFVSQRPSGASAIFQMNADGTNKTEITPVNSMGTISWSPQGDRITFDEGPDGDILVVSIDGTNRHNVTSGPAWDFTPSWSPDGSRILFSRYIYPDATHVYGGTILHTIRPDGTDLRELPNGFYIDSWNDDEAEWSPAGDKIVFRVNVWDFFTNIDIADADGTNRRLFDGCVFLAPCDEELHDRLDRFNPSWSPDGNWIVYTIADRFQTKVNLFLKNIDGSGFRQLTTASGKNFNPSWQPVLPAACPNPIDCADFFVRQHYRDFLSREPETSGYNAWLNVLNNCPDVNNFDPRNASAGCDRITVSAAFFNSPEFQLKGYYVFRLYRIAFDRVPTYEEMIADMQSVTGATSDDVYAKKATYVSTFAQRSEFTNTYGALTNDAYVTALINRYGLASITAPDPATPDGMAKVTLTASDLMAHLDAGTLSRAQVLRAVADSDRVNAQEFNPAFVAMEYYGYLRRTPEEAGYSSWLNYLNAHPQDFRTMVNGFMNSIEYRRRFGN